MSDKKGGYRLVSLKLIELSTMTTCAGLYQAIESSHDKPLCLCDILVSGAKKNNVYITAIKGTNKYTLKNVYGYDIEVTNEDVVEVTENADGIELPKPTPEDDGSLVGVNVQGKYVLKPNPLGEATQVDNGRVLEVINGAWSKGEKKVNVMDSPSSDVLTEEEYNQISGGVFINGTYLGLLNPVLFPFVLTAGGSHSGLFISVEETANTIRMGIYTISSSKKISFPANNELLYYWRGAINKSIIRAEIETSKINDKAVPLYPSDTGTFTLKCVDGVLTWVQDQ